MSEAKWQRELMNSLTRLESGQTEIRNRLDAMFRIVVTRTTHQNLRARVHELEAAIDRCGDAEALAAQVQQLWDEVFPPPTTKR